MKRAFKKKKLETFLNFSKKPIAGPPKFCGAKLWRAGPPKFCGAKLWRAGQFSVLGIEIIFAPLEILRTRKSTKREYL